MLTNPAPQQQNSVRPIESMSLRPSTQDTSSSQTNKTLKLTSKGFRPKIQLVQEYLKKGDIFPLPSDFMDNLTTTLNMTGKIQINRNAAKLKRDIKSEYIPQMAHFVVVRRVIESDENRIRFFAEFFTRMRDKSIVSALIKECIYVILKITVNEYMESPHKIDAFRASTTPVKNVAWFLGYLTLAQNKPLLAKDLDLKQYLVEAHAKRCIPVAIIVACKILRTGESSKIFKSHNQWMVAMYSLLIEYKDYIIVPGYNKFNQSTGIVIFDPDRSLEKEINLVLRNRKPPTDKSQP